MVFSLQHEDVHSAEEKKLSAKYKFRRSISILASALKDSKHQPSVVAQGASSYSLQTLFFGLRFSKTPHQP